MSLQPHDDSALATPHAHPVDEVLRELGSRPSGLCPGEVRDQRARHGANALPRPKPPSVLRVALRQFASPLIYILLVAAIVSAAIGDVTDAGFIMAVLALNATIGAVQEFRAERAAEALRSLVVARAHVLRGGEELEVDAEEVVPGDVVVLESGSKVPADLRLISGGLEIDESLLTGESLAVVKRPGAAVAPTATLGDRATMAFAGTIVTRGRAHGVAVSTGATTELGQIATTIGARRTAKPPLVIRMELFTRKVAIAVGVAVVGLGAVSWLRGVPIHDVFLGSVALAVAVIPEGLPVAMTVALAIAVHRMSRRKVIARRLVAVEALGSCTFIASDKTGTLTLNELTVERILLPGESPWEVTGKGVAPEGSVELPSDVDQGEASPRLTRLATAVALSNDGTLAHRDEQWVSHGDAVDVALLVLAEKIGVSRGAAEGRCPRLAAIPFEAERRFSATVNDALGGPRILVKGAVERVMAMSSRMMTAAGDVPLDRAAIEAQTLALAAEGYRVLAVADGRGRLHDDGSVDHESLGDLTFLGVLGMIDPLRPEAREAIDTCRKAGIGVAMVTGDHPVTALAVARAIDLAHDDDDVVTGADLEAAAADPEAFDAMVGKARVFARVEPQQKLEIVQALIRRGHFVAVTGDGANDAPAMRAAHIGVAMGERGTDVARETGELILADDNFASIVAGVEEGRIAYGNVRKVIFLLVSTGAGLLVLFLFSMAFGLPLALLPVQLLWLNLVTNGIQDVALAFEPGEGGELERPPRSPGEPVFDAIMIERTLLSALVIGSLCFATFHYLLDAGWAVEEARNALLLLMVLFQNVQAGNARSERTSLLELSPFRNKLLFVGTAGAQLLHIAAMHTPGLRDVLALQPVSLRLWVTLLGLALVLLVVMEGDKLWRRLSKKDQTLRALRSHRSR
jgi:P-type Ca2+ transporter type 2C